jgi:hypothetical protein
MGHCVSTDMVYHGQRTLTVTTQKGPHNSNTKPRGAQRVATERTSISQYFGCNGLTCKHASPTPGLLLHNKRNKHNTRQ